MDNVPRCINEIKKCLYDFLATTDLPFQAVKDMASEQKALLLKALRCCDCAEEFCRGCGK